MQQAPAAEHSHRRLRRAPHTGRDVEAVGDWHNATHAHRTGQPPQARSSKRRACCARCAEEARHATAAQFSTSMPASLKRFARPFLLRYGALAAHFFVRCAGCRRFVRTCALTEQLDTLGRRDCSRTVVPQISERKGYATRPQRTSQARKEMLAFSFARAIKRPVQACERLGERTRHVSAL